MLVLLDTSHDLSVCEEELGTPVEQLLTPLTRFNLQRPNDRFAIDNGAFSRFDPNGFRSLLAKEHKRAEQCRWVSVPDVVGSAIRTREVFDHWYPKIINYGYKCAYVAQDGQEKIGTFRVVGFAPSP